MQTEKKTDPEINAPEESLQADEPQAEPVAGEFLRDERAFDEGTFDEDGFDEDSFEDEESSQDDRVEAPEEPHPSLVINVQSWATPIVGLLMLVVGLLGGYFGRPLLEGTTAPAGSAALTSPAPAATSPADQANSTASAADRASLMEFLVSQTRHFKGNPDAPVTLIEFSDFQ